MVLTEYVIVFGWHSGSDFAFSFISANTSRAFSHCGPSADMRACDAADAPVPCPSVPPIQRYAQQTSRNAAPLQRRWRTEYVKRFGRKSGRCSMTAFISSAFSQALGLLPFDTA